MLPLRFLPGIRAALLSQVAAAVVLATASLPAASGPALAQADGATIHVAVVVKRGPDASTTLFVQNIAPAPTTATVTFFDLNGVSNPAWTMTAPIGPGDAATFDLGRDPRLPSGFDGSAVVHSPQPITAVANRQLGISAGAPLGQLQAAGGQPAADAFSVTGDEPVMQETIPVVFGGYHGYFTTLSVQNTGNGPAGYAIAPAVSRSSPSSTRSTTTSPATAPRCTSPPISRSGLRTER